MARIQNYKLEAIMQQLRNKQPIIPAKAPPKVTYTTNEIASARTVLLKIMERTNKAKVSSITVISKETYEN